MNKWLLATIFATIMLFAADNAYVCKYCGEAFSSASNARTGYCSYSGNRKHTAISGNGTFVCQYCGEIFSSPSSVRLGYCSYSENHKPGFPSTHNEECHCGGMTSNAA